MAISFADAPGNLFNRWGRLGKTIDELMSYQQAQLTNFTDETSGVVGQYNAESDIQAIMGNSYISLLDGGAASVGGTMQSMATATANRVVFRDNPQLGQTLTQANIVASLNEIIRQMYVEGATVLAMTVTATPTLFTATVGNVGNGCVVMSVKRALDGRTLENAYAETITFTCTSDSYSGTATAGNEGFAITGEGSLSNFFAFDWPLGSNCSRNVNAANGNASNTSGNLLTNSGFTDWTSNVPDQWTLDVGVAGTDISEETGIVFGSTSALKITGNGSTQVQLSQEFDSDSGTADTLDDLTQYAVNLWLRRDGIAPAAGVMTVELVSTEDVVMQDENGVDNSFTIDLTTLTTEYANYGQAFRTPQVMPNAYVIRIRLSTPLTTGRSIYVANTCLTQMSQLYTSGPFVAVFAGADPFAAGDRTTATVTNSRGSGGSLSTFQTLLARLMPQYVYGNELLFPSSSTPSISDTLITS